MAVIVQDKDFALNWEKENSKDQSLESIVKEDDFNKVIKEVADALASGSASLYSLSFMR